VQYYHEIMHDILHIVGSNPESKQTAKITFAISMQKRGNCSNSGHSDERVVKVAIHLTQFLQISIFTCSLE